MRGAGPWQAPSSVEEPLRLHRAYLGFAGVTLLLTPAMMMAHLLFGGMLSTFVIEWHVAHDRPTVLPQVLFFGGALAVLAIPASYTAAALRLQYRRAGWFWWVVPWLSWLMWPSLMVALSLVFDVIRWTTDPS